MWGDGEQTRSFLYIDECIEATRRLMDSDFIGPVNIGSEEMVTINELVETAARVDGKEVQKIHIDGPLGVRGRNSNNDLIRKNLDGIILRPWKRVFVSHIIGLRNKLMVKHKFNLVGNTFNYSDAPRCSVWGKESKFTEWVDEGGDGTFYVDSAIGIGFEDERSGPKYAWILESLLSFLRSLTL